MISSRLWVVVLVVLAGCGGGGASTDQTTTVDVSPSVPGGPVLVGAAQNRLIAGVRQPGLPLELRKQLLARGIRQPVFLVKLCIDDRGLLNPIELRQGSGHPAADEYLVTQLRAWRFATPIRRTDPTKPPCTAMMFRYSISG